MENTELPSESNVCIKSQPVKTEGQMSVLKTTKSYDE